MKIKSFNTVISESTCQKRITVCEIYDENNKLLSRESNRCNPDGGVCHRLFLVQDKGAYDKESRCNWTHAEINAINNLPQNSNPYKAVLYGHDFFCDSCEKELRKIGIVDFLIYPKLLKI